MKQELKEITELLWEELEGAEQYLDDYIRKKEKAPILARTFLDIAPVELEHYDKLKKAFETYVEESAMDANKTVSSAIYELWEFETERMRGFYDELKYRYNQYKTER